MGIPKLTIDWLLDSDPALRWQVMQDLLDIDKETVTAEREKIPHLGWGKIILDLQNESGRWNDSLYHGKWISTTYALYLLKLLGLPDSTPQTDKACQQLWNGGLFQGQEIRFDQTQTTRDLGVTALTISNVCYFKYDAKEIHDVIAFMLSQQEPDGSWWTNDEPYASDYSFEVTLAMLESFHHYGRCYPDRKKVLINAISKGREFLLSYHLYLKDNQPIKSQWTSFSFPAYWFYDVLTALEYFRSSGAVPDNRMFPGIHLILSKRGTDGLWKPGKKHSGKTFFTMNEPRKPSRWNTLRALRVLRWWHSAKEL